MVASPGHPELNVAGVGAREEPLSQQLSLVLASLATC